MVEDLGEVDAFDLGEGAVDGGFAEFGGAVPGGVAGLGGLVGGAEVEELECAGEAVVEAGPALFDAEGGFEIAEADEEGAEDPLQDEPTGEEGEGGEGDEADAGGQVGGPVEQAEGEDGEDDAEDDAAEAVPGEHAAEAATQGGNLELKGMTPHLTLPCGPGGPCWLEDVLLVIH